MQNSELETSLHLFQPPLYRSAKGNWFKNFHDAVLESDMYFTIDNAAILSIISFGWASGDSTLFSEIKRRPWLSKIDENGDVILGAIPPHGRLYQTANQIAHRLLKLLQDEALIACNNKKSIYILLSGGLDSRIIAGILASLYYSGLLKTKPVALTWGISNSRDVYYARLVAQTIGIDWQYIPLYPELLLENIVVTANKLAAIHSPELLHSMTQLKELPPDAIVFAASYGDSIGRAEFGGRHLLELDYLKPFNAFHLLRENIFQRAYLSVINDFADLHKRSKNAPKYAHCEYEMQGFRMRSGLCHALTVINNYCYIYQAFTHPNVYSYIWSIHPVCRNDDIYIALLNQLDCRLLAIPWARTNKALKGGSVNVKKDLKRDYHEYTTWCATLLYDEIVKYIEPDWFHSTGIFDANRIKQLNKEVRQSRYRVGRLTDIWLWLAAFRLFIDNYKKLGIKVEFDNRTTHNSFKAMIKHSNNTLRLKTLRLFLTKFSIINYFFRDMRTLIRKIRRCLIFKKALKIYPPISQNYHEQ